MEIGLPSAVVGLLLLLLGVSMGSFASVLLVRSAPHESWGGRSRCPHCGRTLTPRELIPLLSYAWQRGRCRGCATHISLQYPLLELFGAFAFLSAWFVTSGTLDALALGIILWAGGMILVSDWTSQTIPDLLTALLLCGGLLLQRDALWTAAMAAVPGAVFLGGQWILSRGRWVGSGDVLLSGALGVCIGHWESAVLALGFAYGAGAAYAMVLLLTHGTAARRMRVPFGPFLLGGAAIASFGGAQMAAAFTALL